MEKEIIKSSSNNRIKKLRALISDKALRKEENLFIAEGKILVFEIPDDINVVEYYICEGIESDISKLKKNAQIYWIKRELFESVSDTKSPSGVIAVIEKKKAVFDGTDAIVLDGISDPGNIGTIIRTAVCCGIYNIFAVNCVDIYSPKAVRASMGGVFHISVFEKEKREDILKDLKNHNLYALDMAGKNIFEYEFKNGKKYSAFAVGNEAHGLSEKIKSAATETLSLPMSGKIQSLNAAVSLSIAAYVYKFSKR